MRFGRVAAQNVGPLFGRHGDLPLDEALAAAFAEELEPDRDAEDDEDDEEEDLDAAFGPLRVLHGWVGPSGPGAALQVEVRTDLPIDVSGVEVRLREDGRYVRSALRELSDKDRDLTLRLELEPGGEQDLWLVTGFLPYAALPPRAGHGLVLEAWLTDDGEPVEEQLFRFVLPSAADRWVANALGAVTLAAVAAGANAGRPVAGGARTPGIELARGRRIVEAVGGYFHLDGAGLAVVERLAGVTGLGSADDAAKRLRDFVSPRAFGSVMALLHGLAGAGGPVTPGEARFLDALQARLGVHAEAPRARAARAGGLEIHYDALGVAPGADWDAVRAAYRDVARRHHPDLARPGAGEQAAAHERMKGINAAYAALRRALRKR